MKGFVKNVSHLWAHTMKRSVGPGAQIPLEDLYQQYGKKYDLGEGDEFIRWLQDVKLRDRDKWQILDEDGLPYKFGSLKKKEKEEVLKATVEATTEEKEVPTVAKSRGENVAPPVAKKMTIEDVTGLSFRKAKDVLPGVMDVTLLKYAAQQANQMAGKDSLCRLIRKRIQELEVSTRR
jgi:hypothetical protein